MCLINITGWGGWREGRVPQSQVGDTLVPGGGHGGVPPARQDSGPPPPPPGQVMLGQVMPREVRLLQFSAGGMSCFNVQNVLCVRGKFPHPR